MIEKIKALRKELHQNPEVSGAEANTAKRIVSFIKTNYDTEIITEIGGEGVVAIYDFPDKGPTIGIRCELDALPIEEQNTFNYRSTTKGVSHKCGHDGHMSIVAGLLFWIKERDFKSGTIVLIFQPAEETGQGAHAMLNDERFQQMDFDYLFALHNLPGEALHSILTMNGNCSPEVQSVAIHLKGKECHAAEPENGINPALGMSHIIIQLEQLNEKNPEHENFILLTPVHLKMGEKAYGISPEMGELHYTIRSWNENVMEQIKKEIQTIVQIQSEIYGLEHSIDWLEYFPSTSNASDGNQLIQQAALDNGLELNENAPPFQFGEDFGWFSKKHKAAMFGLGSGINSPALHHADYDFPDEIIETGMNMFQSIIESVLETKQENE